MIKKVGVIGSGSFGITVSSLIASNCDVMIYSRNPKTRAAINEDHFHKNTSLNKRIVAVDDLALICKECQLIFPVVPSSAFRSMMKDLGKYLTPSHILIHATKGLDYGNKTIEDLEKASFVRSDIHTMSEVIKQESSVVRVGCLSGPNLAREILDGKPAATVISSEFDEVIDKGKKALASNRFFVFGSHDITGAELAGAFKNIIAIASGIVGGLDMGKNLQALLITRGLREMVQFGSSMGASANSFLGSAGIGDLIATATSTNSRNYTFGTRLAGGESLQDILDTSDEIIEGLRTLMIIHRLAASEKIKLPITETLYQAIYEGRDIKQSIAWLMSYPTAPDVDFI